MFPLCLFAKGLALVTVRRSGISWALGSASYLCNETSGFIGWTETGHTRERRKRRKALQVRREWYKMRRQIRQVTEWDEYEAPQIPRIGHDVLSSMKHQKPNFCKPDSLWMVRSMVNGQLWMNIPYARYRVTDFGSDVATVIGVCDSRLLEEWRLWLASSCYVL